jgi:hypothetical protein
MGREGVIKFFEGTFFSTCMRGRCTSLTITRTRSDLFVHLVLSGYTCPIKTIAYQATFKRLFGGVIVVSSKAEFFLRWFSEKQRASIREMRSETISRLSRENFDLYCKVERERENAVSPTQPDFL